jgi:hypothetical protein
MQAEAGTQERGTLLPCNLPSGSEEKNYEKEDKS